jgi:L-amino acid N-acyltransferase YncA
MIRYLYDDTLVEWAQERIQHNRFRPDAHALGIEINGELRAVTVWDNFAPRSCFISIASTGDKRWLTREFGVRSMAYPFIQCNFARLTALVSTLNQPSISFVQRFGFTAEGRIREGGAQGEDLIVFGMLKRECMWLSREQRDPTLLDMAIAV